MDLLNLLTRYSVDTRKSWNAHSSLKSIFLKKFFQNLLNFLTLSPLGPTGPAAPWNNFLIFQLKIDNWSRKFTYRVAFRPFRSRNSFRSWKTWESFFAEYTRRSRRTLQIEFLPIQKFFKAKILTTLPFSPTQKQFLQSRHVICCCCWKWKRF